MNFNSISDSQLLERTRYWARTEQESLINLLYHIREVNSRRLYADLKYQSIHEYLVGELGYSEPEAGRRVSAMRLMRDMPELDEKVKRGELTLTNMCLAQSMFLKEQKAGRPLSCDQKRNLLNKLLNCSTREANRIVNHASPEMRKARELSFDSIGDEKLLEKINRLRGLVAHTHPNLSLYELMHLAFDGEIERRLPKSIVKHNRWSSNAVRENFEAAKSVCSNCGSSYALEVDHIHPKGKGGGDEAENLRILCRSCNQRAAIKAYGRKPMRQYLRERGTEYCVS